MWFLLQCNELDARMIYIAFYYLKRLCLQCWETYVGQQIYKLVLLDLIVETCIIIFVQYPRRSVYLYFNNGVKHDQYFCAVSFRLIMFISIFQPDNVSIYPSYNVCGPQCSCLILHSYLYTYSQIACI